MAVPVFSSLTAGSVLLRRTLPALVAGFLLLGADHAVAQAGAVCPVTPSCDPRTELDRNKCSPLLTGTTTAGEWGGWWWVNTADTRPGAVHWCRSIYACLTKYCGSPSDWLSAVAAIASAPTILQGIANYASVRTITPAPGSQDEYDFRLLAYTACEALWHAPPGAGAVWSPDAVDGCVAPTPPAPPAWMTPAKSPRYVYKRSASGGVGAFVPGVQAPASTPCVGAQIKVGSTVYMSWQGGPPDQVTICVTP